MKYYAQSIFHHIRRQISRQLQQDDSTGTLFFMLPTVPPEVALHTGRMLEDYGVDTPELAPPVIRVAHDLCAEWETAGDGDIARTLDEIRDRGWIDERHSLTSYRNVTMDGTGKPLPLFLVGVDRVTDSASLADFYQVDVRTVWELELGGSFTTWVESALEEGNVGFEADTPGHFDEILVPLIQRGLADAFQVSALLESLDLNGAQTGPDAERILLRSLSKFDLPAFSQYRFGGRRSFGPYLDDAVSFFSYDSFLEERARNRALVKIDTFLEHNELGELFDPEDRPSFGSDQEFVDGVRRYVETADNPTRDELLACDFVMIRDGILGFRPQKTPKPKRESVKRLTGGPVEVVLTGLWYTLGEFRAAAVDAGVFAHEALKGIRIESDLFKHDCDGDSAEERAQNAGAYLTRLVGGVDRFIENWLDVQALCGSDRDVSLCCELVRENTPCQPARTAEPLLQFSVTISGERLEEPVVRRFAWRLPEIESYRLAEELIQWAAACRKETQGYWLPVYQAPYYEELMLAKDDEEVRRVLQHCVHDESGKAVNLIGVSDLDAEDSLLPALQKLAFEYDHFIEEARKEGLHSALLDKWDSLRKAYEEACNAYLSDPECESSPLAALLFRSFLFVGERDNAQGDRWVWEEYEPSGVATVLHPALLEMLQAHVLYLLTAFNALAGTELRTPGARTFREITWRNFVDLAAVQMPLCGLLKDSNRVLDTAVRGEQLIHRVGGVGDAEAALTTRLLLRYDSLEDDEVSDAELFRQSRESMLIYRVLSDYLKMHPHAEDGLALAFYQNDDIQPIIAATDLFLSDLYKERDASLAPYALSITVFTESSDDTSVARWIAQWRERWESAETVKSLAHYRKSHLSIAHRIVSSENYYSQFRQLVKAGLEVDIAFLNSFIGAGSEGNHFKEVAPYNFTSYTLKFPILEKSFCAFRDPGKRLQRARVLSNRQFHVCTLHTEIMARLSRLRAAQGTYHVVLGLGDYTPWQGVVDDLHRKAEWVVCIDPNVDERLISSKAVNTGEEREIIGFGSGVGSHGEANYTISTEQFHLSDVLSRLKAAIGDVYSGWDEGIYTEVARSVLREAQRLSGLSLVRATGIGHYIRDFMAYALTRKLMRSQGRILCDQLISLDAYQHWFDSAPNDIRPDLMWMTAQLTDDNRIRLDLKLIECKLAQRSSTHLDKARQQLENGLQHLVSVFCPRNDVEQTVDDRPDQRYWWLQLHRLISSQAEIMRRDQVRVLTALERLSEGDYDVEWQAAALTYWTDEDASDIRRNSPWSSTCAGHEIGIDVFSTGREFVRALCLGETEAVLPWGDSKIRLDSVIAQVTSPGEERDGEDEDQDENGGIPEATPPPEGGGGTGVPYNKPRPEKDAEETTGRTTGPVRIPDRVLLGVTTSGGREVFWEFGHPELSNRHMLIFGTSGMGKTYTVQCLLCELGRLRQNSLIVDYTNGFMKNQLESELADLLNPRQHYVQREPLPINPFRQQLQELEDEAFLEKSSTTAQRVAGVFSEVYSFGDQQRSALYQAVKQGIEEGGEWGMTLQDLIPCLERIAEKGGTAGSSATSVISKIRPFLDQDPFGQEELESWERMFADENSRCHILQLANFARDAACLITEFSLIDLYWFYRNRGTPAAPRVVVLDEVQNLDHREESPLAQLLREGRKFGFSLILATQIMSNLGKDERDRLFNAAHKLFFKPADTEIRTYAEIAAVLSGDKPGNWMKKFATLSKGECYSLGPSLNEGSGKLEVKPFRIRITSLAERGL